jgi:hypothetical protein
MTQFFLPTTQLGSQASSVEKSHLSNRRALLWMLGVFAGALLIGGAIVIWGFIFLVKCLCIGACALIIIFSAGYPLVKNEHEMIDNPHEDGDRA